MTSRQKITGIWLPIITPFSGGEIDYQAYQSLTEYYIKLGISGLLPAATTGESPTLSQDEIEKLVEKTLEIAAGRLPIYPGLGGNNTQDVVKKLKRIEKYRVNGILSVCPYYNRPGQEGIYEHFKRISEATPLNIIIYNIPYRTGVNIDNKTIYRLAELKNIIGIKDSSGHYKQSMELLLNPPADFSILTGEDILYYSNLSLRGDGGILASAHIQTEQFIKIFHYMQENNYQSAFEIWKKIAPIIPLLFEEANPAPIKYLLKKSGLIASEEVRLPLTSISSELKSKLEYYVNAM